MSTHRPLIGMTTSEVRNPVRDELLPHADAGPEEMILGFHYMRAIARAGGLPAVMAPVPDSACADLVERFDGILIPGGPDVDPANYGRERHPGLGPTWPELDRFEIVVVREAERLGKPVLAICRGHQVLNVTLGGTLIQHLPDVIGKRDADGHYLHHNDIDLVTGSNVALAMGTTRPRGHCVHHQAVAKLGDGLVVTAWAGDVVEAVELPDRWVVGVQWHPEDTAATDRAQQALFDAFVAASRETVASS